ncbi:MAG TPA: hypothetical protein VI122_18750, partial [Thermoleophilaceae bacterium]
LAPGDGAALVVGFPDGEVGHEAAGGSAVPVSSPGSTGWAQLAFSANPVEQPVAAGVHRDGEADEVVDERGP